MWIIAVAFVVLAILALITVVGHGSWVVLAWLFRGCRSRSSFSIYEPTLSDDRAATMRHLERLFYRGLVDREACAKLMQLVAEDANAAPMAKVVGEPIAGPAVVEGDQPSSGAIVQDQLEAFLLKKRSSVGEQTIPPPLPQTPTWQPDPIGVETPPPLPEYKAVSSPRRSFSEMFTGFMAEKNIRWGELIGGMLILGCSTALVISLWSHIAAIPALKFVIFTAMTTALFGAGLFAHHRWKLPTTSRAVLLIASMLVPLNFLAFAAFAMQQPDGGGGETSAIVIEVASVFSFCRADLFGWSYCDGRCADRVCCRACCVVCSGDGCSACLVVRPSREMGHRFVSRRVEYSLDVLCLMAGVASWGSR